MPKYKNISTKPQADRHGKVWAVNEEAEAAYYLPVESFQELNPSPPVKSPVLCGKIISSEYEIPYCGEPIEISVTAVGADATVHFADDTAEAYIDLPQGLAVNFSSDDWSLFGKITPTSGTVFILVERKAGKRNG